MSKVVYEIQCSKCIRCLGGITKRRIKGTILCHKCFQEEQTEDSSQTDTIKNKAKRNNGI